MSGTWRRSAEGECRLKACAWRGEGRWAVGGGLLAYAVAHNDKLKVERIRSELRRIVEGL